MKRYLALMVMALGPLCIAQVAVTPIVQPRQTFVNSAGIPCALCKLYSYTSGTSTPTPTYADSTGTSQNTNPIILDVAGGANIWVASSATYKFVLKDALGTTIWTVDNVKSNGGSLPCSTPNAIQYANSTAKALTCDPTIKIDPASHSIQVGGAITGPAFALRNVSDIPDSWTFDVTTPTTALLSLGTIPLNDIATQAADSVVMNATGSPASPTAVAMPTGCTTGTNYNSATHSWTCVTAGAVPLSSLAAQGANTVVMNATSGSASPTAVALPTGCTRGTNYSDSTHTWTCSDPAPSAAFSDVTSSRAFGMTYQNTSGAPMWVSGFANTSGSAWGKTSCQIGTLFPSTVVRADQFGATTNAQPAGFSCLVPNNYFYSVTVGGSAAMSLASWTETLLQ